MSDFTKIRSMGAEMFHAEGQADGQTDRHDGAKVASRNFVNAPQNSNVCLSIK